MQNIEKISKEEFLEYQKLILYELQKNSETLDQLAENLNQIEQEIRLLKVQYNL